MAVAKGWICLHRSLLEHWVYQDADALKVWITMLMEANHEPKKHLFNGVLVEIDRGQLVTGRIAMAEKTGVSEKKVRSVISMLETEGMVVQQKTNKYSIITITNYAQYQDQGQQKASTGPAKGQKKATPKQLNKYINTNYSGLDFSAWLSLPTEQAAQDWFAMRKAKKASVTQTVIDQFADQINLAHNAGRTATECLSLCIVKNWQGFKFQWLLNEEAKDEKPSYQRNQPAGQTPSKAERDEQAHREYIARLEREAADADGECLAGVVEPQAGE